MANNGSIYDQIYDLVGDFCNRVYEDHPHNIGIFNAMILATDKHNKLYGVEATYNLLTDLKNYSWSDLGDTLIVDTKLLDVGEGYSVKIVLNGVSQDYVVSK